MLLGFAKRGNKCFVTSAEGSENTSSYLSGGMYLFGAGTLFMTVLRLQTSPHMIVRYPDIVITQEQHPSSQPNSLTALKGKQQIIWLQMSWVEVFCSCVRLLFTIVQILFLQAFWKSTFNKSGRSGQFMKFIFFHTLATNVCIWLLYTAEEVHIFEHYGHSKHRFCANSTKYAFVELAQSFQAYLVPFTLEYSLIAAGILFGMASRMRYFDSNDT